MPNKVFEESSNEPMQVLRLNPLILLGIEREHNEPNIDDPNVNDDFYSDFWGE
jgi:hypothetical protein